MNEQKKGSFQDYFLSQLRTKKTKIEVHCNNGAVFEGELKWYDNFTIIIKYQGYQMLLYKHSIVAIKPTQETGDIIKEQPSGKRKNYNQANSFYHHE